MNKILKAIPFDNSGSNNLEVTTPAQPNGLQNAPSDQVDAVDEILYKALTSVMPELNQVVYDNAFLGAKAKLNALLLEADDKARLDTMARVLLSVGGELEITRKALTDDINRYVIHQTPTSKLDGGLVYRISDPSEVA